MPIHHPFKVKDASSSNIVMNIRVSPSDVTRAYG
jgi:hypothetical protein